MNVLDPLVTLSEDKFHKTFKFSLLNFLLHFQLSATEAKTACEYYGAQRVSANYKEEVVSWKHRLQNQPFKFLIPLFLTEGFLGCHDRRRLEQGGDCRAAKVRDMDH